jgi:hypothetical protein
MDLNRFWSSTFIGTHLIGNKKWYSFWLKHDYEVAEHGISTQNMFSDVMGH